MRTILITEYWLTVRHKESGQVSTHGPYYSQDAMFSARAGWSNRGYQTIPRTRKVQRQVPN